MWALPFGDDFDRAWRECPRADYLLLLAAVGGAEHAVLRKALCKITRELIGRCHAQQDVLNAMQEITERFMRRAPLPASIAVGQQEASHALRAADLEAHAEAEPVRLAAIERLGAVVANARRDQTAVESAVVRAFDDEAVFGALRAFRAGAFERACVVHTMRVMFRSLTVAKLAEVARGSRGRSCRAPKARGARS